MRDLLRFGAMLRTAGVQLPRTAVFASLSAFHVLVNLIVSFSFETALIVIQVRLLRSCILLGLRMRRLLLCHWTLSFIVFWSAGAFLTTNRVLVAISGSTRLAVV